MLEYTHNAGRSRMGYRLKTVPDAGHYVEKRLDIVANVFDPRHIIVA